MKTHKLPIERWESVLSDVLHSQRSLLCTATNATPHKMFFNFYRKSCCGFSLPGWLSEPGPVLLHNFVHTHKNDDLVRRVELTEANPSFARVKLPNGQESTVSLKDLAPWPRSDQDAGPHHMDSKVIDDSLTSQSTSSSDSSDFNTNGVSVRLSPLVRRSSRLNKGVPPERYGAPFSF